MWSSGRVSTAWKLHGQEVCSSAGVLSWTRILFEAHPANLEPPNCSAVKDHDHGIQAIAQQWKALGRRKLEKWVPGLLLQVRETTEGGEPCLSNSVKNGIFKKNCSTKTTGMNSITGKCKPRCFIPFTVSYCSPERYREGCVAEILEAFTTHHRCTQLPALLRGIVRVNFVLMISWQKLSEPLLSKKATHCGAKFAEFWLHQK